MRRLFLSTILILPGCTTTYTPPANTPLVNVTIEASPAATTYKKDMLQILAFQAGDACRKNKYGSYIGLLCDGYEFCKGTSLTQAIPAETPIKIKIQMTSADVPTSVNADYLSCTPQFTLHPKIGNSYKVIFDIKKDRNMCTTEVKVKNGDGSWLPARDVIFDKNACIWL